MVAQIATPHRDRASGLKGCAVPEGRLTIAQRFIAGTLVQIGPPSRRDDRSSLLQPQFARPRCARSTNMARYSSGQLRAFASLCELTADR